MKQKVLVNTDVMAVILFIIKEADENIQKRLKWFTAVNGDVILHRVEFYGEELFSHLSTDLTPVVHFISQAIYIKHITYADE